MADVRVQMPIKIVDPTTNSSEAAVAALADNTANPTALLVGAFLMGYDGTTWDRIYTVADGDTVAAGTKGFLALGTDGSNYQVISTDSTGRVAVNVNGTVTVDSELPAAAALADDAANPTTPTVGAACLVYDGSTWDRVREAVAGLDSTGGGIVLAGMVAQFDDSSTTTVTENQFAHPRISSRRALLVEGVASGTNVNVNLAASAATVTVDSELPAAAALADNAANPTTPTVGAALLGFDGTNWDRIYTIADGDAVAAGTKGFLVFGSDGANYQAITTDASGHLQVDVLSGGGVDSPTNPASQTVTSSALAAGSSANLDTSDIPSKKCWQIDITASVSFKAIINTLTNGSATPVSTVFGKAGDTIQWRPPHRDWVASGSSAGTDGFRVAMTNLDTSEAADVYATFLYADN